MLTSIRGLLAATVIATSAFAAAPALAQDEEAGPVTVTGSVTWLIRSPIWLRLSVSAERVVEAPPNQTCEVRLSSTGWST